LPERNINLVKSGHDYLLVQVFAGHKYPSASEKYTQTGIEELKAGYRNIILRVLGKIGYDLDISII
jgi:hypothetical protein